MSTYQIISDITD